MENFLRLKGLRPGAFDSHECHKIKRKKLKVCVARARFHLSLARLGKTSLHKKERDLLAEELYQARRRRNKLVNKLNNYPIPDEPSGNFSAPNHLFLFDSTQGREEPLYQRLAEFLRIERRRLPALAGSYRSKWSRGAANSTHAHPEARAEDFAIDLCLSKFDFVRKELLPISHTLGRWLLDYLIPASLARDDVVIPDVTAFREIVGTYLTDPCDNGLVRNDTDGEYYRRST